jgi:hypothetical protein
MSRNLMLVCMACCGLVLVLPVQAIAADKADITGKFTVEGTTPDGNAYQGTAEITKKGDTYQINWTIGVNETYEGVGILEGDTFAVSFSSGGVSGVVAYRVEKGPKLVGKWAVQGGDGKVQRETLTKQ